MRRSHAVLSQFVACAVLLCGGAMVAPATAGRAPGFSTIDVPGATFTSATGINPQGDIVGQYDDAAGRRHGFLLVGGAFTTIDHPDAVSITAAWGINPQGDIVGNYQDSAGVRHGFILRNGIYTSYDFPQAVNGSFIFGISPTGTVVGEFKTTQQIGQMGFAFRYDGTSEQLVPPGSIQAIAWAINPSGEIAGAYMDSANQTHGWVLDRRGTWWTIDFPGATLTNARGINASGEVVGVYRVGSQAHGYLMSRGTFSTIDYPGSNFTRALGISATGDVVGDYMMPGDTRSHAFVLVR